MAPSCTKIMDKRYYALDKRKNFRLECHHVPSNICKFVCSLRAPWSATLYKKICSKKHIWVMLTSTRSFMVPGSLEEWPASGTMWSVASGKACFIFRENHYTRSKFFLITYLLQSIRSRGLENTLVSFFFLKRWQSHRTNHIIPALNDTSWDMTTGYTNERLKFTSGRTLVQLCAYILSIDWLSSSWPSRMNP